MKFTRKLLLCSLKMMFPVLLVSQFSIAESSKPKSNLPKFAYNHIDGARSSMDDKVEALYGPIIEVKTISDHDGKYLSAKRLGGDPLKTVSDGKDGLVLGKVIVTYILKSNGEILEPKILESSDPRLNAPALEAIKDIKIAPAELDGKPIDVIAGTIFELTDQPLLEVRYTKVKDEIKEKALSKLKQFLDSKGKDEGLVFGDGKENSTLLGGFLSSRIIQDYAWTSEEKKGEYTLELVKDPKIVGVLPAILITKPETKEKFIKLWKSIFYDEPVTTIRPLTVKEIGLVWTYIGWDMIEPIFVAETKNHKFVFDLTATGESIQWIEDISNLCLSFEVEPGKRSECLCADIEVKGKRWATGYIKTPSCPSVVKVDV